MFLCLSTLARYSLLHDIIRTPPSVLRAFFLPVSLASRFGTPHKGKSITMGVFYVRGEEFLGTQGLESGPILSIILWLTDVSSFLRVLVNALWFLLSNSIHVQLVKTLEPFWVLQHSSFPGIQATSCGLKLVLEVRISALMRKCIFFLFVQCYELCWLGKRPSVAGQKESKKSLQAMKLQITKQRSSSWYASFSCVS